MATDGDRLATATSDGGFDVLVRAAFTVRDSGGHA